MWINQGDIILVGLRDYQDAKADVILKYNADEARNLKTYGEIPDSVSALFQLLVLVCWVPQPSSLTFPALFSHVLVCHTVRIQFSFMLLVPLLLLMFNIFVANN